MLQAAISVRQSSTDMGIDKGHGPRMTLTVVAHCCLAHHGTQEDMQLLDMLAIDTPRDCPSFGFLS